MKQNWKSISFSKAHRFNLLHEDAQNLPFKENTFDWASIQFGSHEKTAEMCNRIIQQMIKVVKPEGFLVFVDFNSPLPHNFTGIAIRAIERIAGGEHFTCFKNYHSRDGLAYLLQSNMLNVNESHSVKQGTILLIKSRNNKKR